MRDQKVNIKKQNEEQNVSMLFDDALPESLKFEGVVPKNKKGLNLHTDNTTPLSPYIIHLSNHEEPQSATPNLDALAESLMIDPELLLDDDSAFVDENDLSLTFDEIVAQLSEPKYLEVPKAKTVFKKINSNICPAEVPVQNQLPQDIYSEIASFEITEFTRDDLVSLLLELIKSQEEFEEFSENNKGYVIHEDSGIAEEIETMFEEEAKKTSSSFFGLLPFLGEVRFRAIAVFVLLSFSIVLPLQAMKSISGVTDRQATITNAGKAAIENFTRGTDALEADRFDVAGSNFRRASENFADAEESLASLNLAVQGIAKAIPKTDRTLETAKGLIEAGQSLSLAASQLSDAAQNIKAQQSPTISTKLAMMKTYVESILPKIDTASKALERVDPSVLGAEEAIKVSELKDKTPKIAESMREFIEFADTLTTILGDERKMKYLIAFQNNTELRPTGGFIGSFAEMDMLNGEITNIHIPEGGTYDLQGQLTKFVEAPQPLGLINDRWEFHDANWFPDFPTSARKLMWFYDKAGEPTVDGVIAINADLIPALLEITGPIEMPTYERTIDSENFLFETQKIVELEHEKYDTTSEERTAEAPKQFIGDLAPLLLERIQNADMKELLAIADVIGDGLVEKDVQLYMNNTSLQSHISELGWSGEQKEAPGDYLQIVSANLGGGKTDSVIDQQVDIDINIGNDGTITKKVVITKTHKGLKSAIFEGKNNVDYIRLYVPKGSKLLQASGFEIPPAELFEAYNVPLEKDQDLELSMSNERVDSESQTNIWDENGKTVFGNWIQTAPGETQTISFTYELPFKFKIAKTDVTMFDIAKSKLGFKDLETFTFFIQKQSGVKSRITSINVNFPDHSNLVWSSHIGTSGGKNIIVNNDRDVFLRFLIENNIE